VTAWYTATSFCFSTQINLRSGSSSIFAATPVGHPNPLEAPPQSFKGGDDPKAIGKERMAKEPKGK
jgi:hypothetical protein